MPLSTAPASGRPVTQTGRPISRGRIPQMYGPRQSHGPRSHGHPKQRSARPQRDRRPPVVGHDQPHVAGGVHAPQRKRVSSRAFRPSVAVTAESKALVSFGRGHAQEVGTGERRAPAVRDCGSLGRNRKRRACRQERNRRRRRLCRRRERRPGVARVHRSRARGAGHRRRTSETRKVREQVYARPSAET